MYTASTEKQIRSDFVIFINAKNQRKTPEKAMNRRFILLGVSILFLGYQDSNLERT